MSAVLHARKERLAALRAEVRAIESHGAGEAREVLPFGVEALDARLEGGGLATAALHEFAGASAGISDDCAACLFVAGIAGRRSRAQAGATVLWALRRRDLFAPGLAQAGLAPGVLLYAECGCDEDVLAAMEEGLRHGGLAGVVGEVGRAGMSAARRLQLAAEQSGTTALILRRWRRSDVDPLALPSSAMTRWRIACAPSAILPVPGVGRARWHLTLTRQRGGEPFECLVESPDAEGRLALPALPRDRSAAEGRDWQRAA